MKGKRQNRLFIPMVLLAVLITSVSGCDRQAKHKVLTFFFTGVPPLEEERKVVVEKEKVTEVSVVKKKIPPPKPRIFSHSPYAAKRCDLCHRSSAGFGRFRKKGALAFRAGGPMPGVLVVPARELCTKCHTYMSPSRAFAEGLWLHAPAAQGKCPICHNPHQSKNPYLLVEKQDKICIKCHSGGFIMHPPAIEISSVCLSCHNAHLGRDSFMLKKDYDEVGHPVGPLPGLAGSVRTTGSLPQKEAKPRKMSTPAIRPISPSDSDATKYLGESKKP